MRAAGTLRRPICGGFLSRFLPRVNQAYSLCSALVWAFGQALQPGFDDEVRAAWTAVILAVNEQMMIGAAAVLFSQHKPTPVEKPR